MPGKRTWKIGMVGSGTWSRKQLNGWKAVQNAEVVALCDQLPEQLDPVVKEFEIPQAFNDFGSMLKDADIDCVDICTRPNSHAALTKIAADQGYPILCQKPFCKDLAEAKELVNYCKKNEVRLMINENFRWLSWFRKTKELIFEKKIGNIYFASIADQTSITLPEFKFNQAYFSEMPQLVVYEMGVHFLDCMRFLFGEPTDVYARIHHVSPLVKGDDVAHIVLSFPNLTAMIHLNWAVVPKQAKDAHHLGMPKLDLKGTKGSITMTRENVLYANTKESAEQWDFSSELGTNHVTSTQQHFLDCLENKAEFESSGEANLKTMALVYACYQSASEGRVIKSEEMGS